MNWFKTLVVFGCIAIPCFVLGQSAESGLIEVSGGDVTIRQEDGLEIPLDVLAEQASITKRILAEKQVYQLSYLVGQRLSVDEISSLSDLEMTKEQESELKSAIGEFSNALEEIDQKKEPAKVQKVKLAFVEKLNEFLLPQQMISLGERKVNMSKVLQFLDTDSAGQILDVSEKQKRQIQGKITDAQNSMKQG